jgi:uncharacterized protein
MEDPQPHRSPEVQAPAAVPPGIAPVSARPLPSAVRVALVIAGSTILVDLLLLFAGEAEMSSDGWNLPLYWGAPLLLWFGLLILIARGTAWAPWAAAVLAGIEVVILIGEFTVSPFFSDHNFGILTPMRVTAVAFLFAPSARAWFNRRDLEPADGPPFWGLLWVLPVFAAEWLLIPTESHALLTAALWASAGVLTYAIYVRRQERRAVYELSGGRRAAGQAGLGFLCGLAVPASIIAFYLMSGLLLLMGVKSWHLFSLTLGVVVLAMAGAVFEELVFRGIVLRYIELGLGSWPALVLSALLFAAYHSIADYQTGLMFVSRLLFGLMAGAGYLLTRRLWLPIGMHVAVNLGVASLFGSSGTIPFVNLVQQGDPYLVSGAGSWIPSLVIRVLFALALMAAAWRWGRMGGPSDAWALQQGHPRPSVAAEATADVHGVHEVPAQPS